MKSGIRHFFSQRGDAHDRSASRGPLFVLGFHRGGTTFVQRALNCSRHIHIWGEHGGILRFYRQAFDTFNAIPKRKVDARALKAKGRQVNAWSAMENALDADQYRDEVRRHLSAMFAVPDKRRWGFKEIHYHGVEDIRFLNTLFPDCRIALLHRDPVDMFLSHYFVHWSGAERGRGHEIASRSFVSDYRDTMAAFRQAEREYANVSTFDVADIGAGVQGFMKLADFAGLAQDGFDGSALEDVIATRVGSSFGGTQGKGVEATEAEIEMVRRSVESVLANEAAIEQEE